MGPEAEPSAWELMRVLRDIRDDQREMKRSMITRDEWALYSQATDRRFEETAARMAEWRDASTAEHVELHARVDAVVKDVKEVRKERDEDEKERHKENSQRRFTVAVAIFGAALSILTGVSVFILQGVIGG